MGNLLHSYLDRRLDEEKPQINPNKHEGPVITISREVGCNGVKFAKQLADSLNSKSNGPKWKVLSKEVFYESAKELGTDYSRINYVLKNSNRNSFDEILAAFGDKNYKSERRIVKTVMEVIRSFAQEGHCIIVGRGGNIIAHDIKKSIHFRLIAPLDYRIKSVMENNRFTKEHALEFIERIEKERIIFRKAVGDVGYHDEDFDFIINRASFSSESIIEIIERAMIEKGLGMPIKSEAATF
jgi:cytidylate kinase